MPAPVYTIGYSGLPWKVFTDICHGHDVAIVVDMRTVPDSRQVEYDGERLSENLAELGMTYTPLPDLGDLEADVESDPAAFDAAVERVAELARRGGPVLLMCHEPSPRTCRRAVVAERLNDRGVSVTHLQPAGRVT